MYDSQSTTRAFQILMACTIMMSAGLLVFAEGNAFVALAPALAGVLAVAL